MERSVVFRDFQKAQTSDFLNIQSFAQQTFDDVVGDAITGSLRYAGFNTVKSNTAEITVAPGRFYGENSSNQVGAIYALPTQSIISLVQYLCVSQVTQRILTLVVYGVVDLVDVQTRDYLTNTQTLQTQPQAVAMTSSRDAVLAIVAGAESGNPTAPVIGVGQVAITNILVDSNGINSITSLLASQITSTEELNTRLDVVETFDLQIAPRVSALASDIADLANRLNAMSPAQGLLIELMTDMALVKEKVQLPAAYAQYGASFFLFADPTAFDSNNTQALGYNCTIENGVRFPAQNASLAPLSMFSPIDPAATYNASSGLLLPNYTEVLKLTTGPYASSVAIGQYGYQTFQDVEINIPYSRLRAGGTYFVCGNGSAGLWPGSTVSQPAYWLPNFSTYQIVSGTNLDFYHGVTFTDYLWYDTWTEPYWTLDATNHSINGALMAQTFLVSSDMWVTKIGIYLATIASPSADITITLCLCTNGQPDLTKVISRGTMLSANLKVGMNYVEIPAVLASKGSRMAVTVISVANHQIGLATAGSYLDGTFFYSLDTAYFLGDFTKELVLEIWGAEFVTNQTTIEFDAQNLAGGIRAIDLTARMQVPASCALTFECLPSGTGTWLPVTVNKATPVAPFATAPVLMRFRGRFIGSPDIMPGIVLPDSIMHLWCPASTFTFVTEAQTLLVTSTNITIKFRVENFNVVAHSISSDTGDNTGYIALYYGGPPITRHNPASITHTLVDASRGAYDIVATFSGIPTTTSFTIVAHGTTNSVSSVFHIAQMVWYAI